MLEPTYRRLKRALMAGEWAGGTKLEAMRLADDFGVSMTPVRDSLNQLVGEGLVDFTPGEGFRVAGFTEKALRDVLAINALLLETAARANAREMAGPKNGSRSDAYADRMASAFWSIAYVSGNGYLVHLVERMNDRLQSVRSLEPQVLSKAPEQLRKIEASLTATQDEQVEAIRRYHEQAIAIVPTLVARMAR